MELIIRKYKEPNRIEINYMKHTNHLYVVPDVTKPYAAHTHLSHTHMLARIHAHICTTQVEYIK